MFKFIIKRTLIIIPTFIAVSIISFIVIQLPPGDFLTARISQLVMQGETIEPQVLLDLQKRYGLGDPIMVQYWKWVSGIIFRGDFGQSFDWTIAVSELIWSRLGLTFIISIASLIFLWLVAFPIGIYSAVKKYSPGDYIATFFGFIGVAVPDFLLALLLMYFSFKFFGASVGGLFSPEYVEAPWTWGRAADLMRHLWIPKIIIAMSGTASLIRTMRANLLDELKKPYVVTARAKGLSEIKLLMKYPVRVALNPFISTVGWILPTLVSGSTIVSIVLSLPTTGPLMLGALKSQDMYLAGAFILLLSSLTILGTLCSDILLALVDPRIRSSQK
ncbi:MAG: ABC transporter permease [Treponema sp.]|jgi:peptide/nickel transport system permease protein|nr:ABC transporter permease [Treponema sp.]